MLPIIIKKKGQKHAEEFDDDRRRQAALQQQQQHRQQQRGQVDAFGADDYGVARRDERAAAWREAEELQQLGQRSGAPCVRAYLGSDFCCADRPADDRRRRTPSPVGSGEWALRECEAFTTWVNDLRRQQGLDPIHDLRLAVADGTTVVNLTEVVTGSTVPGIEHEGPVSRPQALANLDRCLAHLAARGVDVIGIQASDLAQGDLKASLQLLGQLRWQYDHCVKLSPGRRSRADGEQGPSLKEPTLAFREPSPCRLDNSHIMPGRVDTSPQLSRSAPLHARDKSQPQLRRGLPAVDPGRLVPGVTSGEEVTYRLLPSFPDHSAKPDADSVVYSHLHRLHENDSHTTTGKAPSAARAVSSPTGATSERPPTTLGVAWAAVPTTRQRQAPLEGANRSALPTLGVEERLRSLLVDNQRTALSSAQQFYDGELLLPPPPSRSYGDGATLGAMATKVADLQCPGPSLDAAFPDRERQPPEQGYVPSKPSDRCQGPRAEVLLKGDVPRPGNVTYVRQSPAHLPGQHVTLNYLPDARSSSFHNVQLPQSDQKASDMRTAWNKLFGSQPEWRLTSRPQDVPSGARRQGSRDEADPQLSKLDETATRRKDSFPTNPVQLATRESPMGQSSSMPGQTSGSSSGHRSSYSMGHVTFSTFKPEDDGRAGDDTDDNDDDDVEVKMLGPASKYPEPSASRPSSTRLTPQALKSETHGVKETFPGGGRPNGGTTQTEISLPVHPALRDLPSRAGARPPSRASHSVGERAGLGVVSRTSGGAVINEAFVGDGGEMLTSGGSGLGSSTDRLDADDSIFDFHHGARLSAPSESSSNRSVTPPLPPLSPPSSQPGSAPPTPRPPPGSFYTFGHANAQNARDRAPASQKASELPSVPRTPDLLVTSSKPGGVLNSGRPVTEGRGTANHQLIYGTGSGALKVLTQGPQRLASPRGQVDHPDGRNRQFARSRSLDDVRENGSESNTNLSFDVDNTVLLVEPSELSDPDVDPSLTSMTNDTLASGDAHDLRGQLQKLENMYHDVLRVVGADRGQGRAERRWSIASSDTSSFKKSRHLRGASRTFQRPGLSKDLKSINRRFQRLESHVVTLARSLAHVSSELRAHNSLRRELDLLKRELRELKQKGQAAPESPSNPVSPFDKFRGWIPSLTNPKRINKLTQFFGQEPPLLEIFLKKLGYERYVKNFEAEHIGMIELPYMTEERLQTLGIPMGPRLRILQESQLCFRQENFDIYIV